MFVTRRTIVVGVALGLLLSGAPGCGPLASFVRTGPVCQPRPEDAPVRVFLTRSPDQPFTEIGVVEVSGGDLAWRVEEAKYAARERGGDAIILYRSFTEVRTDSSTEVIDVAVEGGKDEGSTTTRIQVPVVETSNYQRNLFVVARLQPARPKKIRRVRKGE